MKAEEKIRILDAFLAEVRRIGIEQIKADCDAGDPLAQVRAGCNVLEAAFKRSKASRN